MKAAFLKYLSEHQLCQEDDHILLAVSGGVDSVVMADLFARCGFNIALAHANFSLRGKASEGDRDLVAALAETHQVPFHTRRFQTKEKADQDKVSIQMAARELRYSWFEELRQDKHYDLIATAHHLDDQVETVLFNLAKGTGIAGLLGIPVKIGLVIRPLLFATKESILKYAKARKLSWREDQSNAADQYARNFLRHQVIPKLRELNPNLEKTMRQTTEKLKGVEAVFQERVERYKASYIKQSGRDLYIDKQIVEKAPAVVLFECLKFLHFNYHQVEEIYQSADQVGKRFLTVSHQLNIDRSQLIVSPLEEDRAIYHIAENDKGLSLPDYDLALELVDQKVESWLKSDRGAALDYGQLSFPLTIRGWQPGDWFYPLGMAHKKKLSDFLIDQKVPLNLKARVQVLICNHEIAWVIGHRIDDRFKITQNTEQSLILKIQSNH